MSVHIAKLMMSVSRLELKGKDAMETITSCCTGFMVFLCDFTWIFIHSCGIWTWCNFPLVFVCRSTLPYFLSALDLHCTCLRCTKCTYTHPVHTHIFVHCTWFKVAYSWFSPENPQKVLIFLTLNFYRSYFLKHGGRKKSIADVFPA